MPGAPGIDPAKAAMAMELADTHNPTQIAAITQLKRTSIYDILGKHGHWGEIADRPVFIKLRQQQQAHLEAAFRAGSAKLLERAFDEDKLQKASTYQLVIASSIAVDKARLLAGEPTEITASVSLVAIQGIDRLASILSQSLLSSNDVLRETIEIKAEPSTSDKK